MPGQGNIHMYTWSGIQENWQNYPVRHSLASVKPYLIDETFYELEVLGTFYSA